MCVIGLFSFGLIHIFYDSMHVKNRMKWSFDGSTNAFYAKITNEQTKYSFYQVQSKMNTRKKE